MIQDRRAAAKKRKNPLIKLTVPSIKKKKKSPIYYFIFIYFCQNSSLFLFFRLLQPCRLHHVAREEERQLKGRSRGSGEHFWPGWFVHQEVIAHQTESVSIKREGDLFCSVLASPAGFCWCYHYHHHHHDRRHKRQITCSQVGSAEILVQLS